MAGQSQCAPDPEWSEPLAGENARWCAAPYSIIEKHACKGGYCFAGNSTLAAELDKNKRQFANIWLMKRKRLDHGNYMENNVMVRDGIYLMLDID